MTQTSYGRKEIFKDEKDIHPDYRPVVFLDTTTGYKFLSGSTKSTKETVEFEGETYPLIRVEISSDSHPFYTGRQKFTQADGRVDRFNKNMVSKTQTLLNKHSINFKSTSIRSAFSMFEPITYEEKKMISYPISSFKY